MKKIKSIAIILDYHRYGIGFKTKLGLFLLSCIQLSLVPLYYLDRHLHSVFLNRIASLFLKDAQVNIEGRLFVIGSASDLFILLSESKFISYFKKGDGVFLDIGGHIGKYAITFADYFKRVLVFEPELRNFERLEKNITLNHLGKKIFALQRAAYHVDNKKLALHLGKYNLGGHTLLNVPDSLLYSGTEVITTVTVDTAVQDAGITFSDVGFIKIDVEGAEIFVLEGMRHILDQRRAKLIVEIWDWNQESFSEVQSLLDGYGYVIERIDKDNIFAFPR